MSDQPKTSTPLPPRVLCVLSDDQMGEYQADFDAMRRPGVDWIHEASADDALDRIGKLGPGLVIVGMTLGATEGLEFVALLFRRYRDFSGKVIVLPNKDDPFPPMIQQRDPSTGRSSTEQTDLAGIAELVSSLTPPQPVEKPPAAAAGPPARAGAKVLAGVVEEQRAVRAVARAGAKATSPVVESRASRDRKPTGDQPPAAARAQAQPRPKPKAAATQLGVGSAPKARPPAAAIEPSPTLPVVGQDHVAATPGAQPEAKTAAAGKLTPESPPEKAAGKPAAPQPAHTPAPSVEKQETAARPEPVQPVSVAASEESPEATALASASPAAPSEVVAESTAVASPAPSGGGIAAVVQAGVAAAPPRKRPASRMKWTVVGGVGAMGAVAAAAVAGVLILYGRSEPPAQPRRVSSAVAKSAPPVPTAKPSAAVKAPPTTVEQPAKVDSTRPQETGTDKADLRQLVTLPLSYAKGSADYSVADGGALEAVVAGIISAMASDASVRLEVGGHTSGEGATDLNLRLGYGRATKVVTYLARRGVSAERIVMRSYGTTTPLVSGSSSEEQDRNRRVTVRLVE